MASPTDLAVRREWIASIHTMSRMPDSGPRFDFLLQVIVVIVLARNPTRSCHGLLLRRSRHLKAHFEGTARIVGTPHSCHRLCRQPFQYWRGMRGIWCLALPLSNTLTAQPARRSPDRTNGVERSVIFSLGVPGLKSRKCLPTCLWMTATLATSSATSRIAIPT